MITSEDTTLLIVEDDVELCTSVAAAARHWALPLQGRRATFSTILQTTTLEDGLRALDIRPDLIILDVRLGDGSGLALARVATRMSPMPLILAASGEASAAEAFALSRMGVRGYLSKPFDLVELREAIEAVVSTPPELDQLAPSHVGVCSIHTVQEGVKRAMLVEALSRTRGNYVRAAELLGLTRPAIQQMVKRYELTDLATRLREEEKQ